MSFREKIQYWFPAFVWIGVIFWMSTGIFSAQNTYNYFEPVLRFFVPSISRREIIFFHIVLRKLAHLTEYFISGILVFRAFRNGSDKRQEWSWALSSIFVVLLIAASDEFHQTFVSTRTASLVDVGIDVFGGILAQGVSVFRFQRRRQTEEQRFPAEAKEVERGD
jgi:VanZ family protein